MSTSMTAAEIRAETLRVMGPELGELHFLLRNELVSLHITWLEFRTLFADTKQKFDLMNQTAPRFFVRLNDTIWQDVLLRLCKLTDRKKIRTKENLTVMRLRETINDEDLKVKVGELAEQAQKDADFARDWRNRHLAHRDLTRAKSPKVHPLKPASRADVEKCLEALRAVVNLVQFHYMGSETMYQHTLVGSGGVAALLYFLRSGLTADEERKSSRRASTR